MGCNTKIRFKFVFLLWVNICIEKFTAGGASFETAALVLGKVVASGVFKGAKISQQLKKIISKIRIRILFATFKFALYVLISKKKR